MFTVLIVPVIGAGATAPDGVVLVPGVVVVVVVDVVLVSTAT
jgi:hypothetical protein